MVSELHRLGYQRLRIMPYEAEQGCRLLLGPVEGFAAGNGAFWAMTPGSPEHIMTGPGDWPPFGWKDATTHNARQLADKFISRFPELCAAGLGSDWQYAGWLSELLGVLEKANALPVVNLEFMSPNPWEMRSIILRHYDGVRSDAEHPLPPPGLRGESKPRAEQESVADRLLSSRADETHRDLRNFATVAALLGVAMGVGVKMFTARDDSAEHDRLLPITAAFAGNDPSYTIDRSWCCPERLGRALIERFGLPVHILPDDKFESLVLFGLEHVSLAVSAILANTEAKADWEGVTWPLLTEVHTLAASVFVGSSATLFPTLTLDDLVRRSLRN